MNFIFTIIGWLGWNWFEFTNAKEEADNKNVPFDFKKYASKKWDNWGWTAIVAVALLLIGHAGLGLELVKTFNEGMEWSDLWYFGSGPVSEMISFAYRRWIKRRSIVDEVRKDNE